ncbi:MAG: putative toxin-antitoxin system toxin component, PIN family [Caldisphaeraceae archaeon]|nr:putative toxin-antitoxin system toxin component, PIN family [Caldisphaeraceae archaeon]MEB3797431.1 putative toxin-antitoxin system toxin component, PIN family [Caldisphaeraceae archaeon]
MQRKRFLLDTNVFIAAFKSGYTKTTQLILKLLSDPNIELVVNSVLLEEYKSWLNKLSSKLPHIREQAEILYSLIVSKAVLVEPDRNHIEECKPFIPEKEYADLYHAVTCLKANAILITNDKDFNRIAKTNIIKVWSITRAIRELLKEE